MIFLLAFMSAIIQLRCLEWRGAQKDKNSINLARLGSFKTMNSLGFFGDIILCLGLCKDTIGCIWRDIATRKSLEMKCAD